jgi:hypothetical protein
MEALLWVPGVCRISTHVRKLQPHYVRFLAYLALCSSVSYRHGGGDVRFGPPMHVGYAHR